MSASAFLIIYVIVELRGACAQRNACDAVEIIENKGDVDTGILIFKSSGIKDAFLRVSSHLPDGCAAESKILRATTS